MKNIDQSFPKDDIEVYLSRYRGTTENSIFYAFLVDKYNLDFKANDE